jgi:hypothetical protein
MAPSVCSNSAPNFKSFALNSSPSISTGLPHLNSEEDTYEGMLIPKGSTIFIPIWALHHSEHLGYEDPEKFNPDRYLNHPKLANDYAGSPDYNNRDKCLEF